MRNIEKIAIVLIVLWFLALAPTPLITVIMAQIYGAEQISQMNLGLKTIIMVSSFVGVLVNIGVAVWLYIQAKKDKNSPWVWCLFSLVFGIIAAVLYFLMQLIEQLKQKDTFKEKTQHTPA